MYIKEVQYYVTSHIFCAQLRRSWKQTTNNVHQADFARSLLSHEDGSTTVGEFEKSTDLEKQRRGLGYDGTLCRDMRANMTLEELERCHFAVLKRSPMTDVLSKFQGGISKLYRLENPCAKEAEPLNRGRGQ